MVTVSDERELSSDAISWDIMKLSELGVNTKLFSELKATPEMMRDLLKGMLYLRELFPQEWCDATMKKTGLDGRTTA